MSVEEKIKLGELGDEFLEKDEEIGRLNEEIVMLKTEQERLREEIIGLMEESDAKEIYDDSRGIYITLSEIKETTFLTRELKKHHPKKYELCRQPSKRFSREVFKKKFPKIAEKYTQEKTRR